MKAAIYVIAFFAGASVFSFLEVLICRIPEKKNFVSGHSVCDGCGHELSPLDMVPVFGWLLLGGKCRYCKAKFPPTSSIKEFIGGCLTVLCILRYDLSLHALCVFLFICILNPAVFICTATRDIPVGFGIAGLVVSAVSVFSTPTYEFYIILAGGIAAIVFSVVTFMAIKRKPLVRIIMFSAACGFFLGLYYSAAVFISGALVTGIYSLFSKSKRFEVFTYSLGASACACAFLPVLSGII